VCVRSGTRALPCKFPRTLRHVRVYSLQPPFPLQSLCPEVKSAKTDTQPGSVVNPAQGLRRGRQGRGNLSS
jgi:hypothetical protein